MVTREAWLREKRRRAEERMDTIWAPIYDDDWGGYINESHRRFIERFLGLCPPGATILDAACGTGKYWPLILASGRGVVGADQSQGMLDRARAKFPDVPTDKVGFQEFAYDAAFPGVICMDAMELVCPEDWPTVLRNFARALAPPGWLYCTVELTSAGQLDAAFAEGRRLGLPVVHGELAHEDGYHYYPPLDQARRWMAEAGFQIAEEGEGDDYHHIIARLVPVGR